MNLLIRYLLGICSDCAVNIVRVSFLIRRKYGIPERENGCKSILATCQSNAVGRLGGAGVLPLQSRQEAIISTDKLLLPTGFSPSATTTKVA
jgi:hypothetical protein